MPSDPTREILERQIALQRVGNGVSYDVRQILVGLFDEIVAELARWGIGSRSRVERLVTAIEEIAADAGAQMHDAVRASLAEIGAAQGRWGVQLLRRSVSGLQARIEPGSIGSRAVKTILDTEPFQGEVLEQWFANLDEQVLRGARQIVQNGMIDQLTIDQMRTRLIGTGARGGTQFSGGLLETVTRHADGIVRTGVMEVSNTVLMDVWEANSDIVSKFRVLGTLDDATCEICGPLDGEEFEFGDTNHTPPFHVRCRCVTVPVLNWRALGVEAPPEGTRASQDGPVRAGVTYERWFGQQSAADQDAILGPARAQLFREGRVSLADLVSSDGRILRISELQ